MAHTVSAEYPHFDSKQELYEYLFRLVAQGEKPQQDVLQRLNNTDTAEWADPTGTSSL